MIRYSILEAVLKIHFMKTNKKQLTIKDFSPCIPWTQLECVMGKRENKRFLKWLQGQTCVPEGVYVWDLERYLKGLPVVD